MQHKQHKISIKCSDHGLIYVQSGDICYPIVETKKGEKTQTWQLIIQCFNKSGDKIYVDSDNCDDILLSSDIGYSHIIINQISTCGKKHIQKSPTVVDSGKNIGKKNETTIIQQSLVVCDRKYDNMMKKKQPDSQIQTILPMLLSTYAYAKLIDGEVVFKCKDNELNYPIYVQRKLDGLRCVTVKCNLFSRGQKQFTNLTVVQDQILTLNAHLQSRYKKLRINIDGELYLHGKNLQEMNRIIRNGNADTKDLIYNIFDVDCIDVQHDVQALVIFNDRLQILQSMREYIDQKGLKNLCIVDTFVAETESDLQNIFKQFVSEGYEGIVARNPEGLYEYSINGKRSKDVLRCKPRRDLDVQVVDFCEGNGKDTGAVIWVCEHQNKQFNVVQNASLDSRSQQFKYLKQNPDMFQIIKKMPLQIEYNEESEDGLPLQPRAIIFRQDKTLVETNEIHQILAQFGLI